MVKQNIFYWGEGGQMNVWEGKNILIIIKWCKVAARGWLRPIGVGEQNSLEGGMNLPE